MIHGAHVIIYSKDADADRAFLRDVLGFHHVDAGGGWLIFGLPPAEVAVHPASGSGSHEMYLMCDDVEKFRAEMAGHGVPTGAVQEERWGLITDVALPSGAKLGVYEPRHPRPAVMTSATATKASGTKAGGTKASGAKASGTKASGTKASGTKVPAKQAARRGANKLAVTRPATRKSAAKRAAPRRR